MDILKIKTKIYDMHKIMQIRHLRFQPTPLLSFSPPPTSPVPASPR